MFTQNRSLNKVDARPSDIITLLISTNRPMVALSGPPQQADAFIVSVGRGKTQPVYLCFHIIKEGQRLIFTSNAVPTSQSARIKLEEEALRFAEEMGFMMVRERFDELSSSEREDTLMDLAPFVDDISEIRHDRKRDRKEKKDRAAKAAESEMEYEEVYEEEEVEEEIPVEEEPPKPEEYESLSDVVTEVSAHDAPEPALDNSGKTQRQQPIPAVTDNARTDEGAYDLGEELSDMVETIREIPENARPAEIVRIVRPQPSERAAEQTAQRPEQPEPEGGPPAEIFPEKQQAIIKLLISL
jgi:hypothetical protein